MTPELAALVGELRGLMAATSPRPWVWDATRHGLVRPITSDLQRIVLTTRSRPESSDAALIVAAVNALPALLDAVEAGERENATWQRNLEDAQADNAGNADALIQARARAGQLKDALTARATAAQEALRRALTNLTAIKHLPTAALVIGEIGAVLKPSS